MRRTTYTITFTARGIASPVTWYYRTARQATSDRQRLLRMGCQVRPVGTVPFAYGRVYRDQHEPRSTPA